MKLIIILNGKPTAGKDTFVECCSNYAKTRHISSVGLVKKMALKIGWDGIKDEEGRLLLSNLKKTLNNYHDTIFEDLKSRVADWYDSDDELLFIDIREPKEIERAVKMFGAVTMYIDRDVDQVISNDSDKDVENYKYDFIISNNGTLADLDVAASNFVSIYKVVCE